MWVDGKFANTPETAGAMLYFDQYGEIVSYKMCKKFQSYEYKKWQVRVVSLEDYAALEIDDSNHFDYLEAVPFGEQAMFLYDTYEPRENRLTNQEEYDLIMDFSESNQMANDGTERMPYIDCSLNQGDIFCQLGTWWIYSGQTCSANDNSGSGSGHNAIVQSYAADNSSLSSVLVTEAWYELNPAGPHYWGEIVTQSAQSEWWNNVGACTSILTSNLGNWENTLIAGFANVQADDNDKKYFFQDIPLGYNKDTEFDHYYCSLLVHHSFLQAGADLITNESFDNHPFGSGSIISPNEIYITALQQGFGWCDYN